MPPKQDLPSELDQAQVLKAAKALLSHIQKQADTGAKPAKQNLLAADVDAPERETPIWLSLTTKNFIVDSKRLKPARIPLAHPFTAEDATVCLFTKDPQRTYKDMVAAAGLEKTVTRVVGVSKLKGKHKTFEAKRALRDAHDVFLADDRVVKLLPSILGKTFYAGKHNPIPVVLPTEAGKEAHLKIEIEKALACTYLHLAPGTCTTIKVALAGQTAEQVAENIKAVTDKVVASHVPQKWQNIKSLHIKTASSIALPIFLADKVFDPETDKVQDVAATLAIEEKKNDAKKRKHSKEVPGIELESVQEVIDGVPQPVAQPAPKKKAKQEAVSPVATKAKVASVKETAPKAKVTRSASLSKKAEAALPAKARAVKAAPKSKAKKPKA